MQDSDGREPAEDGHKPQQVRPAWKEVRTRDAVESKRVLELAGMKDYAADEVSHR